MNMEMTLALGRHFGKAIMEKGRARGVCVSPNDIRILQVCDNDIILGTGSRHHGINVISIYLSVCLYVCFSLPPPLPVYQNGTQLPQGRPERDKEAT